MTRVRTDLKCELCESVLCKIIINKDFHKILIRKCKPNCKNDKKILEDYGYSEKAKIKLQLKEKIKNDK